MQFLLRRCVVALAGVALSAGLSHASGLILGANFGMQSYTGDGGEGWKPGSVYGATVDYSLNSRWEIGASLAFSNSRHENDGQAALIVFPGTNTGGIVHDELKNLQFGVNAKLFPIKGWAFNPYVTAGIGRYGLREEFSTAFYSETVEAREFGFRGGVGFRWMWTSYFGFTGEGDYHAVLTEDAATTFFGLRAGASVSLDPR